MEGDVAEILEDFLSGPLVTWLQALGRQLDPKPDHPRSPQEERRSESPQDCFLRLVGGDTLLRLMEMIDLTPGRVCSPWNVHSNESHRLQKLQTLLQRLRDFYRDDLQQLILTAPPNIHLLAREPLTAQSVEEMRKLLLLLLGGAVQCERRDEVIGHIQTLDVGLQASLASAIREVTREPETVLRLQWKELGPSEVEQLLRGTVSRVRELVDERNKGLQKLWELQQEQDAAPAPPPEDNHQHLGVQLAEVRAQVRRLQNELEEKAEELLDQRDAFKDLEGQLHKIRQENRALVGDARLAGLYRDELDALREKTLRLERLQAELGALRELLPALEQSRAQLKEEREFSQALLETKALLEEQLETARARGQRLNQLEKDKLLLQSSLHQAQEEREQLFHQTEELLRENLGLERRLRQSLGEPLDVLRAEELEFDWAPNEPPDVPVLLSCEANETGRLLALERENQGLRRKLQEALEEAAHLGRAGLEEETHLHREPALLQNQAEPKPERRPEVRKTEAAEQEETAGSGPERKDRRAHKEEAGAVAGLEVALAEARTLWREARREREALEERLGSLQGALADALAESERERARRLSESERLLEEVQALEREREASRAGAEALRAAATQAELQLAGAQERLQAEQRQGARLSRKTQQAEEDLREARRELEALQRGLEQHKVALAQLGAEKGALEEALGQAETQRRALDRDGRRLKAQAQAQEEALAVQVQRLAHLEAQSRRQAVELSALADVSQRLGELEQESAGLRGQLGAQRETSAALEEELQKEKTREKEREAALVLLKEQLLNKEESLQEAIRSLQKYSCTQSQELQEEHSSGRTSELEEENSALKRQVEELHTLNCQLTHDLHQAKGLLVLPPSPEEKPLVPNRPEGQGSPDLPLLPLQANGRNEALSGRLLEVERRNAALQAERLALSEHLGQLKSQVGNLEAVLLDQRGQLSQAKEESGQLQARNSSLQVEAAALRSQQALLDSQVSQQGQRLVALEAELRGAQKDREDWRGRHEALLRDHDCLMVLHDRQGSDLEGLQAKHASLKGALRGLEQEHHELQGRHSQLLGQKAGLEEREAALQKQKELLEEAERHHRTLTEQHGQLKEEHERVKQMLLQADRARDDLQGELHGSRNRLTGLQLEQARLEAENVALKEQNQQLDTALGRLGTQCELLAQLKGNQEEENRHLLEEIQVLSKENRRLLERSMESREHFQEEQRQYLDKLGELRREKQKLVEKIMDQYRVLDPALPRSKKSSWIAEKIRKLMKPRRDAPRELLRPMAEGAGSSESLTGPEGDRATDGAVSSAPGSPASLRKASSVFSIPDAQQVNFRRHRLSSRMPAADADGSDTPRQRFRQRRLGMLGGSREEAIVSEAPTEWDGLSQVSGSSQEKRGPPLGEEEKQQASCDVLEGEGSPLLASLSPDRSGP